MGAVDNKARQRLDKKNKNSNVKKSLIITETVNFKVMKTIIYKPKTSKMFMITFLYTRDLKAVIIQFLCGYKKKNK